MSFTATVTGGMQIGSTLVSGSKAYVESARISSIDETFATGLTDAPLLWTLDVSQVQSIIILSDQDIKIETNAVDATGGNTLNLKANVPYIWTTDSYDTFKLTEDVEIAYITNASGATATLKIEGTYNPTA